MVKKLLQYSFIIFAFSIPLSRGLVNLFLLLTLLLWVLEGNFYYKLKCIKKEKIVLAFMLIAVLTLLSALFSNSYYNSFLAGSQKSIFLTIFTHYALVPLIIAVMITSIEKSTLKLALSAFLSAVFFSEIVSYLIYLHLIDVQYFKSIHLLNSDTTFSNPSPFMNHIEYSVFLSIAILFLLQTFLDTKKPFLKIFIFLFLTSATVNLFINGGRTGQLVYICAMLTYALAYFRFNIKMFIPSILAVAMVIAIAYNFSSVFHNRMHEAAMNIKEMKKGNFTTSWGMRAASNIVTTSYLTSSPKHFIFGAGAGDAHKEYLEHAKEQFNPSYYNAIKHLAHIHNQYLEYWMDGTVVSLLLFIAYLILMLKLKIESKYKPLLYSFTIAVGVAATTDIPLFRTQPAMMIMFLSGYLIMLANKNKAST